MSIIPKIIKNGSPINTNEKMNETVVNNHITAWNNNACIDNRFTCSSELSKKKRIGTRTGAKNALACTMTFDHLSSTYHQPAFLFFLIVYIRTSNKLVSKKGSV